MSRNAVSKTPRLSVKTSGKQQEAGQQSDAECIHDLIFRRSAVYPDAVAVICGDQVLTYRELEERANQIARYLRAAGVGPEVFVGICIHRSVEMIVGILGILKAGGAYVPLDPEYPVERLKWMLDDAKVTIILTHGKLAEHLPDTSARMIAIDRESAAISDLPCTAPRSNVNRENPAYLIYTSGSTGRPKGVIVCHRGLVTLAQSMSDGFFINHDSRVLQFSSLSFDASVSEWSTALLSGARLVLQQKEKLLPGPGLLETLTSVTVAILPPAVLELLPWSQLPSLQTLIVAGEACGKELVCRWSAGRRMLNAYGPTETTVCASVSGPLDGVQEITIGSPIASVKVHIADPALQALPSGVAGELYIAGAGLARGYIHQPGMTAERFLPDPFAAEPGQRLYRTGDLARYGPDGNLVYLGRCDDQVKIRGHRIELGEIEVALRKHPAVSQAAVVARDDSKQFKRLLGYVVPRKAQAEGPSAELWPSVAEYFIYDHMLYSAMTNDTVRNEAYLAAFRKHVDGKVVVDVGTGPQALLAKLCLAAGAARVYAIEYLEATYQKARAHVGELGLEARIHVLHGDATEITLPEKADVCVSEIVGPIGGCEGAVAILNGVRDRLLRPGGIMVPRQCTTRVAAVCLPEHLADAPAFSPTAAHYVRDIFQQMGYPFDLRVCVKNLTVEALLSDRGIFEDIDFRENQSLEFCNEIILTMQRPGRMNGLLLWLNMTTAAGIEIDILAREHCWLPVYVPLFHPGIDVQRGDQVRAICVGRPSRNGRNPNYAISGAVYRGLGSPMKFEWQSEHYGSGFRKSPFYEALFANGEPAVRGLSFAGRDAIELNTTLREYLATSLPEYMVPSAILEIAEMPLTTSGKVDRGALPAPDRRTLQSTDAAARPQTKMEDSLASLCAPLLELDTVNVDASFIALGGDSLSATRIAAGIAELFGIDLPLQELLGEKTLRELARDLDQHRPEADHARSVSVPVQRGELVRTSFSQERLWFISNMNPSNLAYHAQAKITFLGDLQVPLLEKSLDEMVRRHQILRTVFVESDGYLYQAVREPWLVSLNQVNLEARPIDEQGGEAEQIFNQEVQQAFDVSQLPLVRWRLMRFNPHKHVLIVVEHHLIHDGWSFNVFLEELAELYRSHVEGRSPRLRANPLQFAEFAQGQRDWMASNEAKRQGDYWTQVLTGAPPVLELPHDRPRPPLQTFVGQAKRMEVDSSLETALEAEARRSQTTLFTLLAAAFQILLCHYSGQDDFCIGVGVANRRKPETQNLIGMVVNNIVLRARGTGDSTIRDLVRQARTSILEAHQNQELPFDKVVELVQPVRNASYNPLFQVMLNYHEAPKSLPLPGLTINLETTINNGSSKFDLNLTFLPPANQSGTLDPRANLKQSKIIWEYNSDLFDDATIERMMEHYQRALWAVVKTPGLRVSEVQFLGPEEWQRTVCEWSQVANHGQQALLELLKKQAGCPQEVLDRIRTKAEAAAKVRVYLLDRYGNPVPVGVAGEICVGGLEVEARHGKGANLTSGRLVPDRFGGEAGVWLYCTGEFARYDQRGIPERVRRGPGVDRLRETRKSELVGLSARQLKAAASEKLSLVPNTAAERAVLEIWRELLPAAKIGMDDNFFDLGGHSLLLMQMRPRIEERFQRKIALIDLFQNQTIRAVACLLSEVQAPDRLASNEGQSRNRGKFFTGTLKQRERGSFPLSFAQQRLWFFNRFHLGPAIYNTRQNCRITGELRAAALEEGLNEIVRRHEALRTRFESEGGEPVQVIEPELRVKMRWVDVSGLEAGEGKIEVERLAREEGRKRFDLERGPLLRATVIRQSEQEHVLLLSLHHIICDGWSMGVLFGELEKLYGAYRRGEVGELEELPIQYADYAMWQREWLQGEVLEEQVRYWKEQLAGAPGLLELPTDRPRPPLQSYGGQVRSRVISGEILAGLKELNQRAGTTLFMTLLAGLYGVLHRYSGAEDVVIGSPIANRNREETERLIGFFVNTLALRVRVEGEQSFVELLEQVKRVALGAYEHQDLPFEKLVEELQPERSLSYHPLFQVMLVLQNASDGEVRLPGAEVKALTVQAEAAIFDLSVELREDKGQLRVRMLYNTDILDGETVDRMLGHYARVLETAARAPATKIKDLPLLSPQEWQQLIVDWNHTAVEKTLDGCVHEVFEQQVERSPDSIAVVAGLQSLTYSELNRRANQLARYLRTLGVGRDVPVALYLNSSQEMIVAALAVLKAGGAYVPMDPSYPLERFQFMLRDSAAPIVLTVGSLAERLQSESGVVALDDRWDEIAKASDSNLITTVHPENLAYIIYTSGSTGRPKGAAISHSSLTNLLQHHHNTYRLDSQSRVSQFVAPGFDGWVWEVWPTLAFGASLHLVPDSLRLLPVDLMTWLLQERITVAGLPTPVAEAALKRAWPAEMPLRLLFTGGDRLHPIPKQSQPFQLINLYGPTENTVATTSHAVVCGDEFVPPVGQPIANVRVYLLDANMVPVPVGVPGELYIGGSGLARGYWSKPGPTASCFIPSPFGTASGERLYRTGDIMRWHSSGQLEFLRRRDDQVKIRGYRIELGEIESVLKDCPDITDCAVAVEETTGTSDAKNLVAYVVLRSPMVTAQSLQFYLKKKLPEFMIPSAYRVVESLPLDAHGKVDRRSLARSSVPVESRPITSRPGTALEGSLAAVWSEVLALDINEVDIHDDFFVMGGHSLSAIKLVTRINATFHCELPVKQIFETSSIAELAEVVQRAPKTPGPTARVLKPSIRRASRAAL